MPQTNEQPKDQFCFELGQFAVEQPAEGKKKRTFSGIAYSDAQTIAAANAKAAYLGLEIQIDSTGKATVAKLGDMQQAAVATQRTIQQVSNSSSNSKFEDKKTDEDSGGKDYWDAFKKKMSDRVAKSNAAAQARRSSNASGVKTPMGADSALTSQPIIPDAPMIASSFDIKAVSEMQPTETKRLELFSGNNVAQLNGSPDSVDAVEEMMRQFETIKRST